MTKLPPQPEHLTDDAVQFIDSLLDDPDAGGRMRTQMALKAMLTTPRTTFQKALRHDLTSDPNKMEEVLKKTTPEDFRAFLRDQVLDKEKDNIPETLAILKDIDPKEYNKVLQGWAKIALPSQKETNINVEIQQKADMYSRIQRQYGLSQLVEDVEPMPEPVRQPLPEPALAENKPKVVRPYDFRAAIDPTFFDPESINREPPVQPDYNPTSYPYIDDQEPDDEPY